MELYSTLSLNQKNKTFLKNSEYVFYLDYRHLLDKVPQFKFLASSDDDFDIMRANIVIKSIINKTEIEEAIAFAAKKSMETYGILNREYIDGFLKERISDLPYLNDGANKVYIPIFTRALNIIYTTDFEKLLKAPYDKLLKDFSTSVIDPFENYSFSLYDSFFTKLLKVKETKKEAAFYHFDSQTIYFINSQGRLDSKIALFDKYLKRINTNHILERIAPVVDAYLKDDKEGLYSALLKNDLVSQKLIHKIKHNEIAFQKSINKKLK